MYTLSRSLVDKSGISFARLGDIVQVPAYKLARAAAGSPVLSHDEATMATHVLEVFADNRELALKQLAAMKTDASV